MYQLCYSFISSWSTLLPFFLPAIRVTSIHGLKRSKVLSSNGRSFPSPITGGLPLSTFQAFLESQTEWTKFHVFPKSPSSGFLFYLTNSKNYQRMAFSTQFCSMKQDHLWIFYQPEVLLCCVCDCVNQPRGSVSRDIMPESKRVRKEGQNVCESFQIQNEMKVSHFP